MNVKKSGGSRHPPSTLIVTLVCALVLAACAPAATPTPAPVQPTAQPSIPPATPAAQPVKPTESAAQPTLAAALPTAEPTATVPATTFVSKPSGKQTASGFDCPEPQPKVPVTSKALNLFVSAEYVPQDMLDCFQEVYGIRINRSEFSSNEEMYAKLAQGSSQFDLTQPSDYIIEVMIRTGILDKFDKSKLPNLKNIAPECACAGRSERRLHRAIRSRHRIDRLQRRYRRGSAAVVGRSVETGIHRSMVFEMIRVTSSARSAAEGKDPNTTNPDDLKAIKPKLAELLRASNCSTATAPKSALIPAMWIWVTCSTVKHSWPRKRSGVQVCVSDGRHVLVAGWFRRLVKEAPHPDAAYAWLNYMLQPDVFWLMLRDFPYTNPNRAALEYARNATFKVKDADGNEVSPAELYDAYRKFRHYQSAGRGVEERDQYQRRRRCTAGVR